MATVKKKNATKPKKKPVKKKVIKKKKPAKKKTALAIGRKAETPSDEMTVAQLATLESLAQLGYNNLELAAALDVSERSFYYWIDKDPALLAVIKRGRTLATAKVKGSLLKRANGYDITQTVVERTPDRKDKNGEIIEHGKILRLQQSSKHYPPDVKAALIWLSTYNKEFKDFTEEAPDNTFETKMKQIDKQLESNVPLREKILEELTDEA